MNHESPNKTVAIIGYSGHGFVAADILKCAGYAVLAYCDNEEKEYNPYSLQYLGTENDVEAMKCLMENHYFISVGDNRIREKIYQQLTQGLLPPVNAIHPSTIIASSVKLGNGVMVAAGAVINPLVKAGNGTIINTASSIDHECVLEDFVHIGPGAIVCGNVTIGQRTFIGAGSVIRQGITIGKDVMIGAGSVIVKDVPDNMVMVGNPQKELIKNKNK